MAKSNAKQVYDDLVALGLSPGAAAGVVGNLIAESSVNPGAIGDNGTSAGIAQWHASRWTQLKQWARMQGMNWQLLSAQTGFLVYELKKMGLWDKLKRTDSADYSASLIMTQFERPKDQSPAAIARRQGIARSVLAAGGDYKGSANTTKAGGGVGLGGAGEVLAGQVPDVGGAIGAAADRLVSGAQPLIIKGLVGALAVALIGVGLVKATGAGRLVTGGA